MNLDKKTVRETVVLLLIFNCYHHGCLSLTPNCSRFCSSALLFSFCYFLLGLNLMISISFVILLMNKAAAFSCWVNL